MHKAFLADWLHSFSWFSIQYAASPRKHRLCLGSMKSMNVRLQSRPARIYHRILTSNHVHSHLGWKYTSNPIQSPYFGVDHGPSFFTWSKKIWKLAKWVLVLELKNGYRRVPSEIYSRSTPYSVDFLWDQTSLCRNGFHPETIHLDGWYSRSSYHGISQYGTPSNLLWYLSLRSIYGTAPPGNPRQRRQFIRPADMLCSINASVVNISILSVPSNPFLLRVIEAVGSKYYYLFLKSSGWSCGSFLV